jgi:hypothetical protein
MTPGSEGAGGAMAGCVGPAEDRVASTGRLRDAVTICANCYGWGTAGIVTVTQRISTGIDSEATSTTVHAVI